MGNANASIQRHARNIEFPAFIKDWHEDKYVSLCEKSFLKPNYMKKVPRVRAFLFSPVFVFMAGQYERKRTKYKRENRRQGTKGGFRIERGQVDGQKCLSRGVVYPLS